MKSMIKKISCNKTTDLENKKHKRFIRIFNADFKVDKITIISFATKPQP